MSNVAYNPSEVFGRQNLPILAAIGSLAISLLGIVAIALWNADYLFSPGKNQYPDAMDYLTLAEGIATKGEFSRSGDGRPDILRTPFYPLMLVVCNAYRYPLILYGLQCGMLAATIGMVVRTTHAWLGFLPALLVMVLLWMEYRLQIMCFQAMSEIASLFFLTCGLVVLGWPAFPTFPRLTWTRSLAAGMLLGISVMIRPAILYLPLLLSGAALIWYWISYNARTSAGLWPMVVMPIAFMVLPAIWTLRNWFVFGVLTLTPISSHNLVFFAGAGAWQFKYGLERFEAQNRISQKFDIPPYSVAQNPYSQNRLSVEQIEGSLQSTQYQILLSHPISLIASSLIGILKASTDHSLDSLGYLLNCTWKNFGSGNLLRLQASAWQQLWTNDWRLLACLLLYVIQSVALWGLAVVGMFKALWYRPRSTKLVGVGLLFVYGYLVVMLFGIDATYRSTVVVLPALYLVAGYAFYSSDLCDERSTRGSHV